jgi:hypothetical protein
MTFTLFEYVPGPINFTRSERADAKTKQYEEKKKEKI